MPRRGWLDQRIDVLLTELDSAGLSVSREAAGTLITDQLSRVTATIRVSEATARRYLTDEALAGIARRVTEMLADEQPGADPLALPRTVRVLPATLGRCIAGLAEAIQLHLINERPDTAASHVTDLAQLISALGLLTADTSDTPQAPGPAGVPTPPALLLRAARYLDTTASLITDRGVQPGDLTPDDAASLVAAFHRDATRLRTLATTNQRIPH